MRSFKLHFIIIVVLTILLNTSALCQDIDLNKKVDSLIQIALDEEVNNELRREAIFKIHEINNNKGIEFLVKNINLVILKAIAISDTDALKENPCFYSLYTYPLKNWNLIPIIIEELKNIKSNYDLNYYSAILIRNFEKDLVITILEYYKIKSSGTQREIIEKLLARLRI